MVRYKESVIAPQTMIVDAMGRIYADGIHVGWVKRDAGLAELLGLCEVLACELPSLDAMLRVYEGGGVS